MLKKFYRAMVIARAGSAAAHVALNMTDKQLADAGIDRRTFPTRSDDAYRSRVREKRCSKSDRTICKDCWLGYSSCLGFHNIKRDIANSLAMFGCAYCAWLRHGVARKL